MMAQLSQVARHAWSSITRSPFERAFRKKLPYDSDKVPKEWEAYEEAIKKLIPVLEARKPEDRPRIVVITDVEQDYDDLLAIIFLSEMHRLGVVELAGLITNHGEPLRRAKFLRTIMRLLGLKDIPVAKGTVAIAPPKVADEYRTGYYELRNTTFENQKWNDDPFRDGQELLESLAGEVDTQGKQPLTVLLISSLHDIAVFFKAHEGDPAFLKKHFKKFVSQGGYEVETNPDGTCKKISPLEPMFNNSSHLPSAWYFTETLAKCGLPSDAWSKEAAVAAALNGSVFKELQKYGPIGAHLWWLRDRQEFKFYWDPYNAPFRSWLDPSWFLRIRCAMSPDSENFKKYLQTPPSFREALAVIKVLAYDGCAAMGAVGDDIMRALGIMGDHIEVPAYNKQEHKHRVFGAARDDIGGIDGGCLGRMLEVFLVGALMRTWKDAENLIRSDDVKHQTEKYGVDLHIFKQQIPYLKEGNKLAGQASDKKATEEERQQAKAALEKLKSEHLSGELRNWPKVPEKKDIPYELLYDAAVKEEEAKEKAAADEARQHA